MKPIWIISLAALLAAGCKKDNPNALPEATQSGRNTAGFLLDGQLWLPEWKSSFSVNTPVSASWRRTSVGRSLDFGFTRRNDNEDNSLDLFVPNITRVGTFQLNQRASITLGDRNPSYGIYIIAKAVPDRLFLTGPDATGTLTITRFDTVARVVAGTFELTVQEETSPETHQLTDGRFDLKF